MKILKPVLYFVIATLLLTSLPFSGILMPLIFMLSGALLIALSVKWHILYSIFSSAFSIGFICFLSGGSSPEIIASSSVFPLVSLTSAVGVYIALKKSADMKTVLLSGSIGYFGLIAIIYFLYGSNFFADILNIAKDFMLESIDSVLPAVPSDAVSSIDEMKKLYALYFENLKILAPAIILSLFFLLSYFSIKLSSHFAKNELIFAKIPSFSEIHAPKIFLIIAVISYFCQLTENPFVSGLAANVFLALSIFYTLCGYSVVDFFLKLRIKSLAARLGILTGASIVLTVLSVGFYFANPVLIAMLGGMLDSVINYRAKLRFFKGK